MAKTKHRVRRYLSRAKARVRSTKMTIPLAPVAGIIAMPAIRNAVGELTVNHNAGNAVAAIGGIAGLDMQGQWHWETLVANFTPLIAGVATHKIASMLGVNRMLAKSKLPLLRV